MIQSVARATAILEALDEAGADGLPLGDLARQVGLRATTTHNLVRSLVGLGYAAQAPATRRYGLGPQARALGRRSAVPALVARVAAPVVQALQAEVNETVILALYRNGRRVTLLTAESSQPLRVGAAFQQDSHMYQTATGRVLLAGLPPAALAAFVTGHGLPGAAWPGAEDAAALRTALATVAATGCARYRTPDGTIRALAVPVTTDPEAGPGVHLALGLYYPASRADSAQDARLVAGLRGAAERLASALDPWLVTSTPAADGSAPGPAPAPVAAGAAPRSSTRTRSVPPRGAARRSSRSPTRVAAARRPANPP